MARRRELTVVRARLETRLGRGASDAEMADEMDLQAADYRQLVDETQAVRHESLAEAYSDQWIWFADVEDRADQALERANPKDAIAAGIRTLPEREAVVLQPYFV